MKAAYRQFIVRQLVKRGLIDATQARALPREGLYQALVDEGPLDAAQAREIYHALSDQIALWNSGALARKADTALLRIARARGLVAASGGPATVRPGAVRPGTGRRSIEELGSDLVATQTLTPEQLGELREQLLASHHYCEMCGELCEREAARGGCPTCGWPALAEREVPVEAAGPETGDPLIGRRLGRCVVTGTIGAGGMGAVYRARHELLQVDVAIKVLPHAMAVDADSRARFLREARLAARLDHPGLLRVMDVDVVDGLHYIVMELVAGPSLDKVLAEGPLAPTRAVELTLQACRAVAYAHEQGMIHRDLKPANLILTERGAVKVADFGLARELAGSSLSISGAVMGSPGYLAPEQADGEPADQRADIYALGVTLYTLLVGCSPFIRPSLLGSLRASAEEPLPHLEPPLPVALDAVLQRMSALDPDARYAGLEAAIADLEAAAAELA